jgi:choline dehydrogenase-like flavoprotein
VPLGFAKILFNRKFMWLDWKTQPDESLGGTVYGLPHGKLLGGSSAINGLVHVRGNPGDYDAWEKAGATGWNYASLLPYFKKSEHDSRGETEFHGGSGAFKVEPARWTNPLTDAFIDATSRVDLEVRGHGGRDPHRRTLRASIGLTSGRQTCPRPPRPAIAATPSAETGGRVLTACRCGGRSMSGSGLGAWRRGRRAETRSASGAGFRNAWRVTQQFSRGPPRMDRLPTAHS